MVLDTAINSLINCQGYHERRPEYGERVWKAVGEKMVVFYWDEGNGWCSIIQVLPKNKKIDQEFKLESLNFFRNLQDNYGYETA